MMPFRMRTRLRRKLTNLVPHPARPDDLSVRRTNKNDLIKIRDEQPGDGAAIREVNRQAFDRDQEGRIVDALRDHGGSLLSLVAVTEGAVVGHIMFSPLFRNPFDEAKESGLTGPQVTLMACLVNRGPMTLTELSRTLGMSHSTASGIVDRLQARGLLNRSEDATDGRRTSIAVTDMVTAYVRELAAGPAGRLVAAFERASPGQRRDVTKGLKTLRRLLSEAHESRSRG